MRRTIIATLAIAFLAFPGPAQSQRPTHSPTAVIFDTDMYSDIDDMLALAMLHALQDRGEVKLLAVTVGTEAEYTAPYIDAVDTFYGHGNIPVGIVHGGITAKRFNGKSFNQTIQPCSPGGINYTQYIAMLKNTDGSLVYPHKVLRSADAEEAVHLLRRTLAAEPDGTVTMIQVGYSTNYARLLDSKGDSVSPLSGSDLIKRKVRLLSVMAGNFSPMKADGHLYPAGQPEFNLMMDVPAAQKVFSRWPTAIVVSGFEIGGQMLFKQSSIDHYFAFVRHHPIADTYNYTAPGYRKLSKDPALPHDHATFDLTAVLYAARPSAGYFDLSKPGRIIVLSGGRSRFEQSPSGSRQYLILTNAQKARTLETMEMLASQPPSSRK